MWNFKPWKINNSNVVFIDSKAKQITLREILYFIVTYFFFTIFFLFLITNIILLTPIEYALASHSRNHLHLHSFSGFISLYIKSEIFPRQKIKQYINMLHFFLCITREKWGTCTYAYILHWSADCLKRKHLLLQERVKKDIVGNLRNRYSYACFAFINTFPLRSLATSLRHAFLVRKSDFSKTKYMLHFFRAHHHHSSFASASFVSLRLSTSSRPRPRVSWRSSSSRSRKHPGSTSTTWLRRIRGDLTKLIIIYIKGNEWMIEWMTIPLHQDETRLNRNKPGKPWKCID